MRGDAGFDLDDFLPYLLNQAAEAAGRGFAEVYRAEHGMTRTQWRVLAHLGRGEALTAAAIARLTGTEKSTVSRAVAALEGRGWLTRGTHPGDRRAEELTLTSEGRAAFARLGAMGIAYDRRLRERLGPGAPALEAMLRAIAGEGRSA